MSGQQINFKVVLLGEGSVGKTSCVTRYVKNTFNEKHVTTIQASFLSKRLNIDGQRVNLNIWDTAGQERFHALGPIYYRESNGALLVYDITDNNSFIKVKNWVKELRSQLGTAVTLAIVGNKMDLERNRAVSKEEALTYAQSVGAKHYSTSAKLNQGLDELFLDLSKRMLESQKNAESLEPSTRTGSSRGGNILIDFEESQSQKPSDCPC